MKNVLFVFCFSLGVTLMIFSSYLPQPNSAHAAGHRGGIGSGISGELFGQEYAGTVTRKLPPGPQPPIAPTSASTEVPQVYGSTEDTGDEPTPDDMTASAVQAEPVPEEAAPAGAVTDYEPNPQAPLAAEPPPVESPPAADGSVAPPITPAPMDSVPAEAREPRVVANAGPDRVVWAGWDEITLDGSASIGDRLAYQWRQTGGPTWLTIQTDNQAITTATGMLAEGQPSWRAKTYQFELVVMDADGRDAAASVQYIAKTAPALKIKPTAERRFELRDGYWLAHFTSWATNLESYEQVFEISADRELRFTKVTGGEYELTGGKIENNFVYQAVLYAQAGEPTSFVEFLVDTDEKIPGVVQLGVSWESR